MSPRIGVADTRREQVKRAALECLLEQGFADLSVKDIARRAGVSTGVLYHYFKNKDDILLQALAMAFLEADASLRRSVEQAEEGEPRLGAYLHGACTMGKDNPRAAQILLAALGQVGHSPAVTGRLARLFADFRSYARELIRKARPEGADRLPADRVDALAALVVAVGLGLACQWAVQPGAVDPDVCGAELRRAFEILRPDRGRVDG